MLSLNAPPAAFDSVTVVMLYATESIVSVEDGVKVLAVLAAVPCVDK